MKIVKSDYILTPNRILKDKAVLFEEKIIKIDNLDSLKKEHPQAQIVDVGKNSLLLPGFVNPHVHLEFSANRASLAYGDFVLWLRSVIAQRDSLLPRCDEECLKKALKEIVQSGTTAIGAVSSYGFDMEAAAKSKLKVVYFNEIIGSNPAAADALYADFKARVKESMRLQSDTFRPAVAVHSPYSVHAVLVKKAVELAKYENLPICAHFMESRAEREWIDTASGDLAAFFKEFLNQSVPANRAMEFLKTFEGTNALFVHAVWANDEELKYIAEENHKIVHCPVSNRLLGNGALDLIKTQKLSIDVSIATDGLSSNISLNMYNELRSALFLHYHIDAVVLSERLIKSATSVAARALNLPCGEIKEGLDADMQLVTLPSDMEDSKQICLNLILHTQKPDKIFIKGEEYA